MIENVFARGGVIFRITQDRFLKFRRMGGLVPLA
jgi:hypothetical protein